MTTFEALLMDWYREGFHQWFETRYGDTHPKKISYKDFLRLFTEWEMYLAGMQLREYNKFLQSGGRLN